jgi:nucleotide-binding universal stress UspA family protein
MSYAAIMVHMDVDDGSGGRLRLAVDLARRFGATLIGMSAALVPAESADGRVAALLAAREAEFRKVASAAGIKYEWRAVNGLPDDAVAREARTADLVIVGRVAASASVLRALDAGRLVLRAGRPVLVVPPGVENLAAERIVIGLEGHARGAPRRQGRAPVLARGKARAHRRNARRG